MIELLTAELIGGFVITAAITMLIIAFNSSARVADRVNSAQQGRIAMEEIQQRLRSQTCLFSTEYLINSATQSTGSAIAFIHASPDKMVFFSDLGATGGSTNATGSVGLSPQMRYIYVDPGPTAGRDAGRRATFIDGQRLPSNNAIPYVFGITPATSLSLLAGPTWIAAVSPTTRRAIAEGVTREVTSTGNGRVPYFRYFDEAGVEITATPTAPISAASLESIASVEVTYRILGLSGKDQAGPTSTLDRRTASFSNEIHLKTIQSACS